MLQYLNLAEHAGILILIISGCMTLLWALLFQLRRSDLRRIDIHGETLSRIEDKLDDFAKQLGVVIGHTNGYEARFDALQHTIDKRLDNLHADYVDLAVLVRSHVGEIAAIKKWINGKQEHV